MLSPFKRAEVELNNLYDFYPKINLDYSIIDIDGEEDNLVNKAIKDIYKGDKSLFNKDLFKINNNALQKAVETSFDFKEVKNPVLANKLRNNVAVFSAFKTHKNTKEIQSFLTDKKGNLRSFSKFKKDALNVSKKYNKTWLKTEYNTAVARARTAEQFDSFKQKEHLYPNIEWLPSRSASPREGHRSLWGIIKPQNDPFWDKNFPGNIWNCKCSIRQTDKTITKPKKRIIPKSVKGIENNPKNGEIFTEKHPYFKVNDSKKDFYKVKKNIEKEALKLERKRQGKLVKDWAKKNIPEKKGLAIKSDKLQTKQLNYRRSNVKDIIAHTSDNTIKQYPMKLADDIGNWEYIGWSKVIKGKHLDCKAFTYYKVKIGNKVRYVNVKVHKLFGENPYAIMDSISDKIIKRNLPNGLK